MLTLVANKADDANRPDVVLAKSTSPEAENLIILQPSGESEWWTGLGDEVVAGPARVLIDGHPALRHLDAASIPFVGARRLTPLPGAQILVADDSGIPLIYKHRHEVRTALVVNIDPVAAEFYFSAWFPVLVHSAATHLAGRENPLSAAYRPGEAVPIPGGKDDVVTRITAPTDKPDATASASDSKTTDAAVKAGGGTYMYPAMVTAKDMLEATPAKIRHMICLSDGHTQPADHESLAEEMADGGITVSTVALGEADKQLMAAIAEIGRGRFYETNDPSNVPQIFTKETMEATKSAIKEDLYGCVSIGDHPILAGYAGADLPFTLGYVMTEAKPTAQLLLAVETGDPLLAIGRYGLGTGLAYTSDLSEKWGGEWLAWDGCGKFWAQAIRGVLRHNSVDGMQVAARADAENWRFDIRRTSDDGLPVNGLHWDAVAIDEQGDEQPVDVRETGLGRYEASVPVESHQRLTVRLRDADNDKTSIQHFNRSYPAEYRLSLDVPAAVAALPRPDAHSLTANVVPSVTRRAVTHYAYMGALACQIASVLLRRI